MTTPRNRRQEPFVISSVTQIDNLLALVSTSGLVISRPVDEFRRLPQHGDHLSIEFAALLISPGPFPRVTGLTDGDIWLFGPYTDEELDAQDRAFLATQTTPDRNEEENK